MMQFRIAGRQITVYGEPSDTPQPLIWLHTFGNEGEAVWNACRSLQIPACRLAAVPVADWNDALSPWAAPGLHRKDADFAGHAALWLHDLMTEMVPEVTAALPDAPAYHAIAGYSLAGLFAVWALYQTDIFRRAVAASGSFWYPGFGDYARSHTMPRLPEAVYFSLGDRESRTRHPVMRTVEEQTRALYRNMEAQAIPTCFERNPGNHFQEPDVRVAKGIRWILERSRKNDNDSDRG